MKVRSISNLCFVCAFRFQWNHCRFPARAQVIKWLTRRLCLFVKLTVISAWWMSVAWVCPNCPSAQQQVFILGWPLSQCTHSDRCPLVQSTKQSCAAVLLQRATVAQSPWGGVFSDKSLPNLFPTLNCFFVISSMGMSLWLNLWLHRFPTFWYLPWLLSGLRQRCLLSPSITTTTTSSEDHGYPIKWNF